jgi:hypothetical protein
MNTLFLIISQSKDSIVVSIEEKVRPTIDKLIDALGIINLKNSAENAAREFGGGFSDFNLIEAISNQNIIPEEIKLF